MYDWRWFSFSCQCWEMTESCFAPTVPLSTNVCNPSGHVWQRGTFLPLASWLSWLGLHRCPHHTLPSSVFVSMWSFQLCKLHRCCSFDTRLNAQTYIFSCTSHKDLKPWTWILHTSTTPARPSSTSTNPTCCTSMLICMYGWFILACVIPASVLFTWHITGGNLRLCESGTHLFTQPSHVRPVSCDQSSSKVTVLFMSEYVHVQLYLRAFIYTYSTYIHLYMHLFSHADQKQHPHMRDRLLHMMEVLFDRSYTEHTHNCYTLKHDGSLIMWFNTFLIVAKCYNPFKVSEHSNQIKRDIYIGQLNMIYSKYNLIIHEGILSLLIQLD